MKMQTRFALTPIAGAIAAALAPSHQALAQDTDDGAYALEALAQRLVLTFPGSVTFNGYIEWQEEP